MCQRESTCTCGGIQSVSSHFKANVLSTEEIFFLKELCSRMPTKFFAKDYNLFNIFKTVIPPKLPGDDVKMMRQISTKLRDVADAKNVQTHYFLKYVNGSFTNIHFDSPERVNRTAVTLLDTSDDLVGGQVVLLKDIEYADIARGEQRPENYFDPTTNKPKVLLRVPLVVDQEVGSTLYYNHFVHHGVTKVEKGHRLVLISWFG